MKEKIQLLSRGVFEYENPEIEVSEKEIALEVEAGSHYSGTIQLNSKGMRAFLRFQHGPDE